MANPARIAWNQKRLQLRKHSRTSWPQRSLIRFVGVGIQPCDGRSRGQELRLKVGCWVMLLVNLRQPEQCKSLSTFPPRDARDLWQHIQGASLHCHANASASCLLVQVAGSCKACPLRQLWTSCLAPYLPFSSVFWHLERPQERTLPPKRPPLEDLTFGNLAPEAYKGLQIPLVNGRLTGVMTKTFLPSSVEWEAAATVDSRAPLPVPWHTWESEEVWDRLWILKMDFQWFNLLEDAGRETEGMFVLKEARVPCGPQALHVVPGFAGYRRQIQHHLFEGELGHLGKLLGFKRWQAFGTFAICGFWTHLLGSNQVLKAPAAIESCLGHDYPQDTRLQEMNPGELLGMLKVLHP